MRKMKRFADGGSDKYKAKYDRKIADIESDYKKAQAGKTGRAAEVAKAKYEQRMADAKDDLAKWTGADRTATRAGEKAAERNLSLTRRYGSASPKLEDKPLATPKGPSEAEMTKISTMAPSKGMGFKDAFAAARKAGDKTFTWQGKSFTTQVKGESKPAARPAARSAPKPAADTTRRAPAPEKKNDEIVVKAPPKGDERRRTYSSAESRERAGRMLGSLASAPFKALAEYNPASLLLKSAMKKGGSVKGYAKGGKIDGCAVRGKTRAKRGR